MVSRESRAKDAKACVSLEDVWTSPQAAAFVRNVWPMYVHEISGFDTDFYRLDSEGRWQPDIVGDWLAPVTPAENLRESRSAADPLQPFQRAHAIRWGSARVGFACVGGPPFRYMPEGFDHSVAELFVVHSHRDGAVAREAVSQLLDRYPGRWHLRAIHDNARAIAFWRCVLPALGARDLAEEREARDVVWTFRSPR